MTFDPWAEIRRITSLRVHTIRLPDLLHGCTDGKSIYLDDRLTPMERRCVLTHELVHLWAGHNTCQPPAVERAVREETARLLIPLAFLREYLPWTRCPWELADELHVTETVLRDRLEALSEGERHMLARVDMHH